MIKHFINLEWKQYFRSSYWQKSIVINILLIFFALYFVGIFLFMGAFLYKIIGKAAPDQDPFLVVNNYIFYWFIGGFLMSSKSLAEINYFSKFSKKNLLIK